MMKKKMMKGGIVLVLVMVIAVLVMMVMLVLTTEMMLMTMVCVALLAQFIQMRGFTVMFTLLT